MGNQSPSMRRPLPQSASGNLRGGIVHARADGRGFPSVISTVAKYVLAKNRRDVHKPVVITSGEALRPEQRAAIEKGFGCRVFDQRGRAEQSIFAAEIACGHIHVSPDYGS